jgi:hypothetical protein
MSTVIQESLQPDIDTPEYEEMKRSGASRETLVQNLVESNFHGLRRLRQYVMAGQEKRQGFIRDLAQGRRLESCPFPVEVALLRALCMGYARFQGQGDTVYEQASAFMATMRFGVHAPHMGGVVEYEPSVFFRAFQGVEVHRDVSHLEDSNDRAASIDWMDFRIYQIPPVEKDFIWDLMQMSFSPWAKPASVIHLEDAKLPTHRDRRGMPVMVGRQRNRKGHSAKDEALISMANPGASLHLCLLSGTPAGIIHMMPTLQGEVGFDVASPGRKIDEVRNGDHWLVATYQPPPPIADARMFHVPAEIDSMNEEVSND